MATSLIRGKYVICRAGADAAATTIISDGAVFQRDGVIVDVGPYEKLKETVQADEVIGGPNFLVFPGLVNTHQHGRGVTTFQMGSCDDTLETWILSGWGRRSYDHYLMTLYTAIQMIESGTTSVMYNHPQTPVSGLEEDVSEILRAFGDSGMRTAFSVYFRGQNRVVYEDDTKFLSGLPADLADWVRKFLAASDISQEDYFGLFERMHGEYGADPDGKVNVLVSPSNVQWVSDEFLMQSKEYAEKHRAGIHIHLVESFYQKEYGMRRWAKTPVAHLNDLGFLGPEVSCAHSVWLTEGDIELLAGNNTTVCHNASSNLRLKNGVAPVNAMLAKGVNVSVGTDSTAINDDDDMLQEMRLVSKLHREPSIAGSAINSHQVLKMSTVNAAQPTFFRDSEGRESIGALETGMKADMVLMELSSIEEPYLDPDINIVDALLYRGKARQVDTVIIDGQVVLKGGRSTKVDKDELLRELKERFSRPQESAVAETRAMARRLQPYVEKFYESWSAGGSPPYYVYNGR